MKKQIFIRVASVTVILTGLAVNGILMQSAIAQDKTVGERPGVYNHWCMPCHAPGPGHPGTQSLQVKYRDSKIPPVLEDREDLTPEYVRTIVRKGIMSMAPFRKTEITDAELDDIAVYLAQ